MIRQLRLWATAAILATLLWGYGGGAVNKADADLGNLPANDKGQGIVMRGEDLLSLAADNSILNRAVILHAGTQEVLEHYYNDPANIHPDPNYTPGDFPLGDVYSAKTVYFLKKEMLAESLIKGVEGTVSTLGLGEVTFSIAKNESAEVLGYFRDYLAVVSMGKEGPERMEMLIDINSLDTAVPGRNNRILRLFFHSMKSELGNAVVVLDQFDFGKSSFRSWKDGQTYSIRANGSIMLNGVTREISTTLDITPKNRGWLVESQQPITLLISDFQFGNRIYDLMKSCNHKSVGNTVGVSVQLYFK